mmetsp:Transcript_6241/g.10828  ORF Transcript_6241/g.10828 Transcript_6241/m.10828 type:complete len:322 (-) Transcript_6241:30-995(-)
MRMVIGSSFLSHFVISSVLSPLKVLGMSLQLSVAPNKAFYESTTTTEVSRIAIAKSHELAAKERSFNALQLSSGMIADNMPFRSPIYANYRQAFMAISGQGYQGFYKGNLINSVHYASTCGGKMWFTSFTGIQSLDPGFFKYFLSLGVSILTDIAFQPLSVIHTRFVLQNRLPQFATYKSVYRLYTKVSAAELYQGYTVILPSHMALNLSYAFFVSGLGHQYMPLVAFGSVACTYPLTTVMRRLEAQSREHTMLPRRYIGWRYAMSKIYNEEGLFRGLYRGFLANSIFTTTQFMLVTLLATRIFRDLDYRSFKSEGLGLVN